jgi:hypothetical protein
MDVIRTVALIGDPGGSLVEVWALVALEEERRGWSPWVK